MIKKIYGITETGEQVELEFKKFLMITDSDSKLTMDVAVQKHPENPDLMLHIDAGPPPMQGESKTGNEHRYFSILPGAVNVVFIKAVHTLL